MTPNMGDQKMRAFQAADASSGLKLVSVDIPTLLSPQDVLVKVVTTSITAGSQRVIARGRTKLPITVGHEIAGIVHLVGASVSDLAVGDRVRVHANLSCGKCSYCTSGLDHMCYEGAMIGFSRFSDNAPLYDMYHNGGAADYVRVPYSNIDRLSDGISFEAAVKVHDVASGLQTMKRANIPNGATIVITAPTGTMGVSMLRLATLFPISTIILIGRSTTRLNSVRHLTPVPIQIVGFDQLDPDWPTNGALARRLKELAPRGVDSIIDLVPTGTDTWQMMEALKTNGTLVHMGGNHAPIPVPMAVMMKKCWQIIGTRGNTRGDTAQILELLASGQLEIEDLITHRFSLDNVHEAMLAIEHRFEPMWMSVINI